MSLYTYHLVEALQGAANQPDDTVVKLSNLMNHLGKTVPASARALPHSPEQTPFFDTAAEDFPIALLCGGKGLWVEKRQPTSSGMESGNTEQDRVPAVLRQQIIQVLKSSQLLVDSVAQQAFVERAGLNALASQLIFGRSAAEFAPVLVKVLCSYVYLRL